MTESTNPIPITDGLWWVGVNDTKRNLQCNPFLLLQGKSAILFDAGSVLDFEIVSHKVQQLVPIQKLDAIVCSHQDPDLCSSLPLFEKHGFKGVYCCHTRASLIISYYGVHRSFYHVNLQNYRFPLVDGSSIEFIFTPYLHFPGAIMTYLPQQKVLLSGDVFGAVTKQWNLYAGPDYEEAMKTFHETYMPSHAILKSTMDTLLQYDISMICPQHGSIITKNPRRHIEILRDLSCGLFLDLVKKDLMEAGGYLALCNQIVKRYLATYTLTDVQQLFNDSAFQFDDATREVTSCKTQDEDIWETFFNLVLEKKGLEWITIIAPTAEMLSKSYAIPLPKVFRTQAFEASSIISSQSIQIDNLEKERSSLELRLNELQESLSRDAVTGLYNQNVHNLFITEIIHQMISEKQSICCVMLSVDNLAQINIDFGSSEGDATLRNLTFIIERHLSFDCKVFRLAGSVFGLYTVNLAGSDVIEEVEKLIHTVSDSEAFIVPITISGGIFCSHEFPDSLQNDEEQLKAVMVQTTQFRLRLAQKRGGRILVSSSIVPLGEKSLHTVLLIDPPGLGRELIKKELIREGFQVFIADNGLLAKLQIQTELPDIIISELMVEKINAITLRKELLNNPETRNIPFLLMSAVKNENTVNRALEMNISHFFLRPVLLVELIGVVKMIAKRIQIEEN
jgi:diguanylate cyclase (GGDEF)-like protein